MKIRFSIIVAIVLAALAGTQVMADVITQEMALGTARNFLSLDSEWSGAQDATIDLVEEEGVPAYYIIEFSEGGWAIVAAQSTSSPIIGYNTTGRYAAPEPMQAVLKANAQAIVDVARIEANTTHEGWGRAIQRKPAKVMLDFPDVAPLIKWDLNQGHPYNAHCPSVGGQKVLVGCVAVGMVQAMMVQQYPLAPKGSHTYNCPGLGRLSIDYDQEAPYDWEAIVNCEKTGDFDEVARILYHSGVAVDMMYGVDGSGAYETDAIKAFSRNFCYDPAMTKLHFKSDYSESSWLELLVTDMHKGRAIVYFGGNETSGHCWNIDGWKNTTQMVHVNWGWGGVGNGYFDIENMRDSYQGLEFPLGNTAIVGVGLPSTAPYGVKLSTTKFVEGTAAGVALADVNVYCEDSEATISYELWGPKNITGKNVASPYDVVDGKLVSKQTVENTAKFTYLLMKVTNDATGEFFEAEFNIQIGASNAVEVVESNLLRLYPSVVTNNVTLEVPAQGGEYTIYSLSGAQVATGVASNYKFDIEVSNLAAGAYIVRYVYDESVVTARFIKK